MNYTVTFASQNSIIMKAYVFLVKEHNFQNGTRFVNNSSEAKNLFLTANQILGFDITKIMFGSIADELNKQVTQPCNILHSSILAFVLILLSSPYGCRTF